MEGIIRHSYCWFGQRLLRKHRQNLLKRDYAGSLRFPGLAKQGDGLLWLLRVSPKRMLLHLPLLTLVWLSTLP